MRAIVLFSGGLDSMLAAAMVMEQGVDVVLLNMVSHFFGGEPKVYDAAKQIGVNVVEYVFADRHMEMVQNPEYGYGKHVNPCIDCHGLMLKCCGEALRVHGADFVVTGEVLGQRPKSQTRMALGRVDSLSGIGDITLRPLSAKLLAETMPERMGWVDRSKLCGISGRRRDAQYRMAKDYGFQHIPSPGGGCILTDGNFAAKMRGVLIAGMGGNAYLLKSMRHGRVFQNGESDFIVVGRDAAENAMLMRVGAPGASHVITDTPGSLGPTILVFLNPRESAGCTVEYAKHLFAKYCRKPADGEIRIMLDGIETEVALKVDGKHLLEYDRHVNDGNKRLFKKLQADAQDATPDLIDIANQLTD